MANLSVNNSVPIIVIATCTVKYDMKKIIPQIIMTDNFLTPEVVGWAKKQ